MADPKVLEETFLRAFLHFGVVNSNSGALLSAREDVAIPPEMVLFGEISLSGALRPVTQTENRLKEASKLGFTQAVAPARSKLGASDDMKVRLMPDLTAFVGEIFGAG